MKLLPVLLVVSAFAASTSFAEEKAAPAVAETPAAEAKGKSTGGKIQDVTPEEAERLLKDNKEAVVLDVRTPEEFKVGHIAGAKNVDFLGDDFEAKVGMLDPDKPYIVHCASGGRSTNALAKLKAAKLPKVYHMPAGFKGWQEAGKPVQK